MTKPILRDSPAEQAIRAWLAGAGEWERLRRQMYTPSPERQAEIDRARREEAAIRHMLRGNRP